jgi:hypothetical protein
VFFTTSKNKIPKSKIAYYIKSPYIRNGKPLENSQASFKAYKKTYNSMYYFKQDGDITYFRTAKNLLMYERTTGSGIPVFIPDFFNTSYKLVKFSKLNIVNKSNKNLLVKTAKDRLYFISLDVQWHDNKRYIAVIDVERGKPLFMASKDDETRSDLLYIIDRKVIPILHFKKQGIFIYLVDLSRDKVEIISWDLNKIHQLITRLLRLAKAPADKKNEIAKDTIKYFHIQDGVGVIAPEYGIRDMDIEGKSKYLYVRSVTIYLDLIIKGKKYSYYLIKSYIKLELDSDKIVCYWDITNAAINIHKKSYDDLEDKYKNYLYAQIYEPNDYHRIFKKSYKLIGQRGYKYISTDLYENDFYYIQQYEDGIMIKYKTTDNGKYHYKSSLFRYGKYLIIIQDQVYDKIAFIDREKNSIYKFSIYEKQNMCPKYRFLYHYYPFYKDNKLLFLSKDLECLMIVNMNKVEHFINLEGFKSCKSSSDKHEKEKYPSIENISIVLDVKARIIKAINNKHKIAPKVDDVIILGHRIDENNRILYIVAKYTIQNTENIGVFVLNISNKELQFQLSSFATRHRRNLTLSKLNKKDKNFKFMSNFKLYKISFDRVNISNLDIYYNDDDAFVSIRYNRVSFPVMKGYHENDKLIIESLDNLIVMKYGCSYMSDVKKEGREYAEIACESSYGFLLYDLVLVKKMPAFFL